MPSNEERPVETKLYYLHNRYYNSEWCRFISGDDIKFIDSNIANGLNVFCYCNNNPIMYSDPDGHFAISLLVGLGVSFLIGFSASVVTQGFQYGWSDINYLQSAVDGLFALGSTALAYTGIGLIGSMVVGAAMGAGQYALDSKVFHDDFSWSGLAIATGLGFIGGALSGRGAQNATAIAGCNLDKSTRSGLNPLLTSAEKYGINSVNYTRTYNLWGGIVSKSINNAISKNFTKSALVIFGYTLGSYAASYGLGKFDYGF